MKVILTKTSHLGAIGSVLTVKSGYAKNYLIPRGMVRYATKINIAQLEKEKENLVKEDGIKTVIAERVKSIINNEIIVILRPTSDDGRLYGAVTTKNVADIINEKIQNSPVKDFTIDKSGVNLGFGIKAVGVYIVKIRLYANVIAEVTLNVARSETEAASNMTAFEAAKNKPVAAKQVEEKTQTTEVLESNVQEEANSDA